MAAQSRTLRNSIISLAIFFALIVALLLGVPGLDAAADRISKAKVQWVVAGVALELLSCFGYVVLFSLVFGRLGRSLSSRLSLAELAVNSAVSVSGMAGIALGAWVLRSKGLSVERIAKRSVLVFVLTSAVNVVAVALIGVAMWLGLVPGSRDPLLTLLPAGAGPATIAATLALAGWGRRAPGGVRAADEGRAPDGGAGGRERRRGGRAGDDPRARLAPGGRGRLLAVRQPGADGMPGRVRPCAFVLGGGDGLPGGDARELRARPGRVRGGGRRAGGDAAAVRSAPRLGGDRGGDRLPRDLAVGARADRLGGVCEPARGDRQAGRSAGQWLVVGHRLPGDLFGVGPRRVGLLADMSREVGHHVLQFCGLGAVEAGAVDRQRQVARGGAGRVDRIQLLARQQRMRVAVGEDVDRDLAGVDLDRVPFVVDRGGHAAHDDVALGAKRLVGVQDVDHGGDLQRQLAVAAAEQALAVHAVAVVDAVADGGDVALEAVCSGERAPGEAVPDPVHAEVGERLRFGELAR